MQKLEELTFLSFCSISSKPSIHFALLSNASVHKILEVAFLRSLVHLQFIVDQQNCHRFSNFVLLTNQFLKMGRVVLVGLFDRSDLGWQVWLGRFCLADFVWQV